MSKHRIITIILIITLVGALMLCGTVLAYMFRQTEYEDNQFTPADVSCDVVETFNGERKSSIQVQNTGNIDAYLRVRFVSYWVDTNGNIVSKPSSMPDITLADGWIKGSSNTYYYQDAVAPTELTDNLLASPIILEKDESGYMQVIEVFAEAIQSKPYSAVTDSWGVTIDSSGNIVSQ
jgi:hypothetical protein